MLTLSGLQSAQLNTFKSHHPGRLFPNIQKLPGFNSHINAVKDEEIQCKNNETIYLYAHVQFNIG